MTWPLCPFTSLTPISCPINDGAATLDHRSLQAIGFDAVGVADQYLAGASCL